MQGMNWNSCMNMRVVTFLVFVSLANPAQPTLAASPAFPSLIPPHLRGSYDSGNGDADMDDAFYVCLATHSSAIPARRRFFNLGDRYARTGKLTANSEILIVNEALDAVDYCWRHSAGGSYFPRRVFDALNTSLRPLPGVRRASPGE